MVGVNVCVGVEVCVGVFVMVGTVDGALVGAAPRANVA